MPELIAITPGVVRRPSKWALRRLGVATSEYRPPPDFLIIGTHRGGTTSLYRYLAEHPCVAPNFPRVQHIKGVRYFDQNYFRGSDWYRSHFPMATYRNHLRRRHGAIVLAGEASPYYLFHPAAAARASELVPHAKILVVLRDPIERAYSHWKRERRDRTEPLETFEDAIEAEPERLAGEVERIMNDERYYSYAHENFSYISQGLYLKPLRTWFDFYPREQIHVLATEDLLRRTQLTYDGVLAFLRLPAFALRRRELFNTTAPAQSIDARTRRKLLARVRPHNRALEAFLGVEFGWDTHDSGDGGFPRRAEKVRMGDGA